MGIYKNKELSRTVEIGFEAAEDIINIWQRTKVASYPPCLFTKLYTEVFTIKQINKQISINKYS